MIWHWQEKLTAEAEVGAAVGRGGGSGRGETARYSVVKEQY